MKIFKQTFLTVFILITSVSAANAAIKCVKNVDGCYGSGASWSCNGGTIQGRWYCTTMGSDGSAGSSADNCWCRIEKYPGAQTNSTNGLYSVGVVNNCNVNCAARCAINMRTDAKMRAVMMSGLTFN